MDPNFGAYITKQYGLLKLILSNLTPCDLRNARLVCQDWKKATDSLLEKNPVLLSSREDNQVLYPVLRKPVFPALVIHQKITNLSQAHPKRCKICKQTFLTCPCQISQSNTLFISLKNKSRCHCLPSDFEEESYLFWQQYAAFLVPSSSKIQISTCYKSESFFKMPISKEVVSSCIGGEEPIKCILVISKAVGGSAKSKWINQLLNEIVLRQGVTFAVGGGDINEILIKRGFKFTKSSWKKPSLILIAFRGENVTAYSDILRSYNEQDIEEFMQGLACRVGPKPEGTTRIAFIVQCVNRTYPITEFIESRAFKKAFPAIPQFGFQAYGEFGIRSSSSGNAEQKDSSKRMKMTFDRSDTTSFVILTLKHE